MSARGRPFRFIVLVVGGWVGARTVMLWPPVQRALVSPVAARPGRSEAIVALPARAPAAIGRRVPVRYLWPEPGVTTITRRGVADPARVALALLGMGRYGEVRYAAIAAPERLVVPPAATIARGARSGSRWSGNAFLFLRDGGTAASATPLLAGPQVAAKIAYAIGGERRAALAARVTAPLGRGPAELAAGAEWQPTPLPLRVAAEARLTGSTVRPAVGVFGGVGDVALPLRFRIDGYGQAGAIGGAGRYAEAQLRLARPIALGGTIDLAVGGWASAQRGASRVDVGPSIGVRLPIGPQGTRLMLDWRQRVAGNARPRSGPALTLGTGF